MTEDERDRIVADAIKAGKCPFGNLQEGLTMVHCPLGFPGCGCADEMDLNPYLKSRKDLPPLTEAQRKSLDDDLPF